MNRDYTHCTDYDARYCPESCFRARLMKNIRDYLRLYQCVSMASLKDTEYCELNKENER